MTQPNPLDRFLAPIRAIIRQELPRLAYLGTWEYRVLGVNADGTVNATATDPGAPMPNLNNLPIRPGPEGGTSLPSVGNTCDVRFINGDPTRPRVVGNAALVRVATIDASETVNVGGSVSEAVILAGGDSPIARNTDAVAVYFGVPPIAIKCQGTFTPGTPLQGGTFDGDVTFPTPATGMITSGQDRVQA